MSSSISDGVTGSRALSRSLTRILKLPSLIGRQHVPGAQLPGRRWGEEPANQLRLQWGEVQPPGPGQERLHGVEVGPDRVVRELAPSVAALAGEVEVVGDHRVPSERIGVGIEGQGPVVGQAPLVELAGVVAPPGGQEACHGPIEVGESGLQVGPGELYLIDRYQCLISH